MLERDIEKHFKWIVEVNGGKTFKFTSPTQRGVADRIACLADGTTWFVVSYTLTKRNESKHEQ